MSTRKRLNKVNPELSLLMWTDTMISMFTMITVAAKNLIAGRISVVFKPFVKLASVVKKPALFSERPTIIIDVVKSQKMGFGLTTTGATIPSIGKNSLILKTIIIIQAMVAMLASVINVPLRSTFRSTLRMLPSVFSEPILGSENPFVAVLFKAFFALSAMPIFLIFRVAALRASFNHGLTSIVKSILDYGYSVKRKAQRPSGNGVGASVPKRLAARTADDMVCSAWKLAAA